MNNLDEIREYYKTQPDQKLIAIATNEIKDLEPGVAEILKAEIKRRKIDNGIILNIDKQVQVHSPQEIDKIIDEFTHLPCPECNSKHQIVNGIYIRPLLKQFLITYQKMTISLGCSDCLKKKVIKKNLKSLGFFFIGIIFGGIFFVYILFRNYLSLNSIQSQKPSEEMKSFVKENIGFALNSIHSNRINAK